MVARDGQKQLWKLSRYYDNTPYASAGGTRTPPVPDEFELYNMTEDPLETRNLAHVGAASSHSRSVQAWMMQLLADQWQKKRLVPGAQET